MTDDNGVCSQSPPSSAPDNVMRCREVQADMTEEESSTQILRGRSSCFKQRYSFSHVGESIEEFKHRTSKRPSLKMAPSSPKTMMIEMMEEEREEQQRAIDQIEDCFEETRPW